jgi:RNA polymerase sigma-70 factor (ECF subfamily)
VVDDTELLRRASRGDGAAFQALAERHARYLSGLAVALAGNPFDADDLIQETLLAAFAAAGSFRGEASVKTWLVKILARQSALLRRTAKRRIEVTGPLTANENMTHVPSTTSETAAVDARLDLATLLAEVSPEHRAVVVLRELEGLSYGEIAAALALPRGTVESRLFRAREQLRSLLGLGQGEG